MRFLLFLLFVAVGCKAAPTDQSEERFGWVAGGQGELHLIDLWDDSESSSRFVPEENIRFLLYTRNNPTDFQEILIGNEESFWNSNYNTSNPVKFTIHGWDSSHQASSNIYIKDAFLSISDVNMITVDWEIGSTVGYIQAVRNVLEAGPFVATFIDWLNEIANVSYSQMHIIGHSLGGQMSGLVGRNTKGKLEQITALDPAHPSWGANSQRIRKTDAKYVEILHTNIGILGMRDPAGHNDFYPNGGFDMIGCGGDIYCSHIKCIDYLAESIIHGGFTSIQCVDVNEAISVNCTGLETLPMGGRFIKPELGIFSLTTNGESPFSQG